MEQENKSKAPMMMMVMMMTATVADPGFLWGGCGGGLATNFFSEGMTPTFYGRLLVRIGVARIFRRWVRPGVDPGFLVVGTMEGPKVPNEAR